MRGRRAYADAANAYAHPHAHPQSDAYADPGAVSAASAKPLLPGAQRPCHPRLDAPAVQVGLRDDLLLAE